MRTCTQWHTKELIIELDRLLVILIWQLSPFLYTTSTQEEEECKKEAGRSGGEKLGVFINHKINGIPFAQGKTLIINYTKYAFFLLLLVVALEPMIRILLLNNLECNGNGNWPGCDPLANPSWGRAFHGRRHQDNGPLWTLSPVLPVGSL